MSLGNAVFSKQAVCSISEEVKREIRTYLETKMGKQPTKTSWDIARAVLKVYNSIPHTEKDVFSVMTQEQPKPNQRKDRAEIHKIETRKTTKEINKNELGYEI